MPKRPTNEPMAEAIIDLMMSKGDKERLQTLEAIDQMHVIAFVAWFGAELSGHEECGEYCPYGNPEDVVDSYIKQFASSLHMSMEATCIANGVKYRKDPNKEVRDEILRENDT